MKNKLLLILFLASAALSEAQTTMENFSYGSVTDSLTNPSKGGANWVRHSGTANPIGYVNTSLTYPGYNSSGIGGAATFAFGSGSREDANRPCINYNSGSVYASFLCRITNAGGTGGDYFFHLMDTDSMTQFRGRIFIKNGSVANTFNIGLNKGTTSGPVYSGNYPIDSTVLIVVKYTFTPGGLANDTAKVYVFFQTTIPATEPSTPTLTSIDISQGDMNRINAIAIRQGSTGTMAGRIDGIRVSNSWADGPLPVTLLDFKANLNEANGTQLKWSTSSETNNKGFEIERSADGENFENVAFVKGAGNSKTIEQYAFQLDYFTPAYYRLKQLDFDGAFEYSQVVYSGGEVSEVELSPNPFVETLKLNSNSNIDKIEIIDLTGKVLVSETINKETAEVETSHLAKGIYFINISQGGSVQTKRIIKTN